jgi:excisionase family DNA binding protein
LDVRGGPGSHGVAPIGRLVRDFGAPAVRDSQSGSLLTVAEVARRLGVCRATVYKLCGSGALPHIRVSNPVCIFETALTAYLDSRDGAQPGESS